MVETQRRQCIFAMPCRSWDKPEACPLQWKRAITIRTYRTPSPNPVTVTMKTLTNHHVTTPCAKAARSDRYTHDHTKMRYHHDSSN